MTRDEIICVDAEFTPEQLEIWKEYGVVHPELNKLYSIRDTIRHSNGVGVGILLNEIINPPVPVFTGVIEVMRETTWRLSRFRTLAGHPILEEIIENYVEI